MQTNAAKLNSPYRMPPEWHPQQGTWLAFPHNAETWPSNLPMAQEEFMQLAFTIAERQHAYVGCDDAGSEKICSKLGERNSIGQLILDQLPTNDAWIRDYGPTFVIKSPSATAMAVSQRYDQIDNPDSSETNVEEPRKPPPWYRNTNQLAAVNWQYNAWGNKYPPFDLDQQAATIIAQHAGVDRIDVPLVLEGGSLEINDSGVLLVTESSVLNPNRGNPNLSRALFETEFKRLLGSSNTIWLPGDIGKQKSILGDDTDGHIDQLARFVNDSTIVYAWTDDIADPQHAPLKQNLASLKQQLAELQLEYDLVALPLPDEPVVFRGDRLPASYCNFLIINSAVIVPQFGDANDQLALAILGEHFPHREIIGLPSNHLSVGLGSFHCLSQQMPVT